MNYPKPFMSITELVKVTGISRDYFKNIALAKDAPVIRTPNGGKFYFKTNELDDYMKKVTEARR